MTLSKGNINAPIVMKKILFIGISQLWVLRIQNIEQNKRRLVIIYFIDFIIINIKKKISFSIPNFGKLDSHIHLQLL